MIRVRDSGGLTAIGAIKVREGGGLSVIANVRVRDAGGLGLVWTNAGAVMTATLVAVAYGYGSSGAAIPIISENVTVEVVGGRAPFTYVWSKVGAPDADWTSSFQGTDTAKFRHIAVSPSSSETASFICTVTDDNGQVVASNQCAVTVENLGS